MVIIKYSTEIFELSPAMLAEFLSKSHRRTGGGSAIPGRRFPALTHLKYLPLLGLVRGHHRQPGQGHPRRILSKSAVLDGSSSINFSLAVPIAEHWQHSCPRHWALSPANWGSLMAKASSVFLTTGHRSSPVPPEGGKQAAILLIFIRCFLIYSIQTLSCTLHLVYVVLLC